MRLNLVPNKSRDADELTMRAIAKLHIINENEWLYLHTASQKYGDYSNCAVAHYAREGIKT